MACFLVPAAEAAVVAATAQIIKYSADDRKKLELNADHAASIAEVAANEKKLNLSKKLMWLAKLLFGGSFLLAYEHIWHGEIVPWFPFLTAAENPADAAEMLHEMSTAGVAMAVLVTAAWAGMVAVYNVLSKKAARDKTATAV